MRNIADRKFEIMNFKSIQVKGDFKI